MAVKPVDRMVGHNIRAQRMAKKMSQETLASRIGLTFQQVQKYEKGANRVGGSRIVQIAEALDISVSDLFAGTQDAKTGSNPVQSLISNPDALRLLEAFSTIRRPSTRQLVRKLVEDIAKETAVRK